MSSLEDALRAGQEPGPAPAPAPSPPPPEVLSIPDPAKLIPMYEAVEARLVAAIERQEAELRGVRDLIKANKNLAASRRGEQPVRYVARPPGHPSTVGDRVVNMVGASSVEFARRYAAHIGPDMPIDMGAATAWALAQGWNTTNKVPRPAMARSFGVLFRRGEVAKDSRYSGYRTLPRMGT